MITGSPSVKKMHEQTNTETIPEEMDTKEEADRDGQDKDSRQEQQDDEQETSSVSSHEPVNLCGAVRLEDVKNLLKEWMSAFPGKLE